ncbi:hypothetical protein BVC80_9099g165 [Macleaya cordata]|uniref:Uncharacterized protein n=1 Tax=Macleaya cordata TaxID=56857 RepID=A0A200PVY7_MACCD|nr:hypothetical protein BVC80_9099g165 [Macleaya cordata]
MKLILKSLQFVSELKTLFEDTLGSENDANGPHKDDVPCAKGLKSISGPSIDLDQSVNVDDIFPSVPSTSVSEVGATSDAGVQRREKRLKKTICDDTAIIHEIRDLMHLIVKDQADKGPSVEECLKSLNELRASHDLPRQLYSTALKAFCQGKDYRVVWMAINDAEDRISFLQSLL